MSHLNTLRSIAGLKNTEVNWDDAALLLIDFQNEYCDGMLNLGQNGTDALANAQKLLDIARAHSAPVFHVVHKASAASPVFNCESDMSNVVDQLQPTEDEQIIPKTMPSSFFNTNLGELLHLTGRIQLIVAGFMSHMCVTATTIKAVELGYNVVVCEDACATRSLPYHSGESVDAVTVHKAAMAALGDRYATVVKLGEFT
ncbi:cysteine hydrolase family protein [Marinomonas mediterranea]|uniref:cysteine hydrolase family protein n=1 Tax=Marinomonas mediterranea TaxID=119864 RepID=UPI00234A1141|nr:cysteine hydrolase family protein [Marinomonas mediterranea]WCN07509.1 isochorismatase family protein [Marinomonas mediterranea]